MVAAVAVAVQDLEVAVQAEDLVQKFQKILPLKIM